MDLVTLHRYLQANDCELRNYQLNEDEDEWNLSLYINNNHPERAITIRNDQDPDILEIEMICKRLGIEVFSSSY